MLQVGSLSNCQSVLIGVVLFRSSRSCVLDHFRLQRSRKCLVCGVSTKWHDVKTIQSISKIYVLQNIADIYRKMESETRSEDDEAQFNDNNNNSKSNDNDDSEGNDNEDNDAEDDIVRNMRRLNLTTLDENN